MTVPATISIPLPLAALKRGHIVDHNGWTVAQCFGAHAEEYAALIVRAVNSHDALLEAAKETMAEWERGGSKIGDALDALQAAIDATEEGAPS